MKREVVSEAAGSGGAERGRRPTGGPPEASGVGGPLGPGQRWSVSRKREVVLRMFRGESVERLSRELGVETYRLERWRQKALDGLDTGLRERDGDPLQAELDAAMKRLGEVTMENELLWKRVREKSGPLGSRRSSK